jgi:DNA polymerase III delta prime subunit
MTSFLIISPEQKQRDDYIATFCKDHDISQFDQTLITRETGTKVNLQSIGIETIKQMQKKLFLKPVKSEQKIVILEEAHLLTTEAQNALLKVLEEPPDHTIILLSADSREMLLPTILSRCQIITLQQEKTKLTKRDETSLNEFLASLPELSIGERLKHAEKLAKDKEKAIAWIAKLLLVARDTLLTDIRHSGESRSRMTKNVNALQDLYTTLKTTNANTRFAIEVTLLKLE